MEYGNQVLECQEGVSTHLQSDDNPQRSEKFASEMTITEFKSLALNCSDTTRLSQAQNLFFMMYDRGEKGWFKCNPDLMHVTVMDDVPFELKVDASCAWDSYECECRKGDPIERAESLRSMGLLLDWLLWDNQERPLRTQTEWCLARASRVSCYSPELCSLFDELILLPASSTYDSSSKMSAFEAAFSVGSSPDEPELEREWGSEGEEKRRRRKRRRAGTNSRGIPRRRRCNKRGFLVFLGLLFGGACVLGAVATVAYRKGLKEGWRRGLRWEQHPHAYQAPALSQAGQHKHLRATIRRLQSQAESREQHITRISNNNELLRAAIKEQAAKEKGLEKTLQKSLKKLEKARAHLAEQAEREREYNRALNLVDHDRESLRESLKKLQSQINKGRPAERLAPVEQGVWEAEVRKMVERLFRKKIIFSEGHCVNSNASLMLEGKPLSSPLHVREALEDVYESVLHHSAHLKNQLRNFISDYEACARRISNPSQ